MAYTNDWARTQDGYPWIEAVIRRGYKEGLKGSGNVCFLIRVLITWMCSFGKNSSSFILSVRVFLPVCVMCQ